MPKGIPRDSSIKRSNLHRLKIVRGHVDRVIKMVEEDAYCIDIIHQSLAVQAALKSIDQTVLKNHMQTCVTDAIKKGRTNEVVDEVMKVVERSSVQPS